MVALLRGAQSGDAESFTCLYAATNPLLVRYLRVVSDADPAPLALATWTELLDGISACAAADDDDWLELAVSSARGHALAATGPAAAAAPAPGQIDEIDVATAALRACGPDVAEVLAMGVVAGLGRDSIARITEHEPTEVLALVLAGQTSLGRPLVALSATFRAPATATEVHDLPLVLPLFTAQAHEPLPVVTTSTASPALTLLTGGAAVAASAEGASAGSSTGTAFAGAQRRPTAAAVGVSPRLARIGVGAAAWTFAVGGVAAAAAMIGVAPAAFDSLFGNGGAGSQGIVAAHGPTRPGGVPSFAPGGPGTTPPTSGQQAGQSGQSGQSGQGGQQPSPQGPGVAGAGIAGTSSAPSTAGAVVSAAPAGLAGGTQVLVVSAVLTTSPTTPVTPVTPVAPSAPAAPTAPSGIPSSPPPAPSSSSTGSGTTMVASAVKAAGTALPKHSTGLSKGRAKAAQAAAARARAKAAAAKARAAAAAHAKAKGKGKVTKSTV